MLTRIEILAAINNGLSVRWKNDTYHVINSDGRLLVKCITNDYTTGLDDRDLPDCYIIGGR